MISKDNGGCQPSDNWPENVCRPPHIANGVTMNLIRQQVYKAIDGERDYQNERWGSCESRGDHSVAEFILYMEHYVQLARTETTTKADPEAREAALHIVRKIAGLAVACMEQNGAPQREGFER